MQNGEKGEFKYRIEAARNLAREGIVTEPVTDDILHVTLGGKRLCWVTDRGDIGYYREGDVEHDEVSGIKAQPNIARVGTVHAEKYAHHARDRGREARALELRKQGVLTTEGPLWQRTFQRTCR